jgi:hypothetical protein
LNPSLTVLSGSELDNSQLMYAKSINTYSYVYGNPIRYFDPLGLDRYDICKDHGAILGSICKACVGAACGFPGANKICCKIDFDDCVAESNGNTEKMKICSAKFNACNLKKEKKSPKKPNMSNDCGDDGGCK